MSLFVAVVVVGTPAILVNDVYLALFHTKAYVQKPYYNIYSYFMGAITFCPHPPFNLHSMSSQPIAHEDWYVSQ